MAGHSGTPTHGHGSRRSSSCSGHEAAPTEGHDGSPNYVLSSVSKYHYTEHDLPHDDGRLDMNHDAMYGSCQEPRTAPACHYTDTNDHPHGQALAGNHEDHDGHTTYNDKYDDEALSMIAQHGSCESFFSEGSPTHDPAQRPSTALKDDTADEAPQQTPTGAPYPLKKDHKNVVEKVIDMVENILRINGGGKDGPSASAQRR